MAATTIMNLIAKLGLNSSDFVHGLGDAENLAKSSGSSITGSLATIGGAALIGGVTAVVGGVTAIGTAAFTSATKLDKAYDTIHARTGAIGKDLEGLQKSFDAVYADFPGDSQLAASTLANLNSYLGITGGGLEDLTLNVLEASRLLGEDATGNAQLFARTLGDWGVPVEDSTNLLDKLFVASQNSGATMGDLMTKAVQFGAPLRLMGFSLEETIALFGKWEKEGVNAELVTGSLRIAAGKFADEGKPLRESLLATFDAIQNNENATDALSLAMNVFGARAGPDMAAAIREGRFDLEDFMASMGATEGAIASAADQTDDWGEKWLKAKNKIAVALAPAGFKMMETLEGLIARVDFDVVAEKIAAAADIAIGAIDWFVTFVSDNLPKAVEAFTAVWNWLKENEGVIVGVLAAIGASIAVFVYTTVIPAALAAIKTLALIAWPFVLIAAAVALLYTAWKNNFGGIQQVVANLWAGIQPVIQNLIAWLQVNIPIALRFLQGVWQNNLLPAIRDVWAWMSSTLFPFLRAFAEFTITVFSKSFEIAAAVWSNVLFPALKTAGEWIAKNLFPILQKLWDWVAGKLTPAFDAISKAIRDLTGWLKDLTEKFKNIDVPAIFSPGSPTPFELGIRGINDEMAKSAFQVVPQFTAAMDMKVRAREDKEGEKENLYLGPTADEIGRAVMIAIQRAGVI